MKTWIEFYDYYLADLPGCSYVLAANKLREAAQEYCRRSQAWRVAMDPVSTVANTSLYEFDVSAQIDVVKVLSAKLDGQPIGLLLDDSQDNVMQPGLLVRSTREFELFPVPTAGQSLVIRCVAMPGAAATGVEDFIYANDAATIAAGAKALLTGMLDRPFSNPVESAKQKDKFDSLIAQATVRAAKAFSNAPLRVRPNFL